VVGGAIVTGNTEEFLKGFREGLRGFLEGRTLTADQLEFVDLVIDHLTARGVMDPKLLYESPFTDFDSKGVDGVFDHTDVMCLIQVLRETEPRIAA
jgi:type I restriction enzyme, R subunit